jgi:hypothetical protein
MADALLLCFVGWWVLAFFETKETKETKETQENSQTTIDDIFPWSQNSNSLSPLTLPFSRFFHQKLWFIENYSYLCR